MSRLTFVICSVLISATTASANWILLREEILHGELATERFDELTGANVEEYESIGQDTIRRRVEYVSLKNAEGFTRDVSCAKRARRCTITDSRHERDEW